MNKLQKALATQTAYRTYATATPARAAEILASFESASAAEHYVRTHNDTHPWTDRASKARVIAATLNVIGSKLSSVARLLVVRGTVERDDVALFEFGPDAQHYLDQDDQNDATSEMVEVPFFADGQFIPAPAEPDGHWSPMFFTADLALFAHVDGELHVLLIRRSLDSEAHPGAWALPGGFVDPDETAREAALREVAEEAGIREWAPAASFRLAALADRPNRDPRGRIVSAVYTANIQVFDTLPTIEPADDAIDAAWIPVHQALGTPLAFDHEQLIRAAVIEATPKDETR